MTRVVLKAERLQLAYSGGSCMALDDVSFKLREGEACGLIGPNGAGKTSLLSIFTTLLKPDRGILEILGHDALQHPSSILTRIGFVPQDLALYERLTGYENIEFFGRMYGLGRQRLKMRLEQLQELLELQAKLLRPVATYSGGMKRRLNLLIALLHEPEILFLDEPTVGIDAQSRHQILQRLHELNEAGMTLVYTSHYLEEVQQLCNRVVIIDAGKVVTEGSPQELVAGKVGTLTELFLQTTGEAVRD